MPEISLRSFIEVKDSLELLAKLNRKKIVYFVINHISAINVIRVMVIMMVKEMVLASILTNR